ncbi:MAG: dTDP-glucose 4,6-dehydratase [Parcubacteria group bacterium]|nr:dTDP-glucose 4,6-dehydratase [Parcubacteria group bacterium]
MKLLVTGGAGFIGSNFIRYLLGKYADYEIVNLDKLTYAGNLDNLADIESSERYRFIKGDICDLQLVKQLAKDADGIINFAAESHVDRSIHDPLAFIDTDVKGTFALIKAAREAGHKRYLQISTDEVYGDIPGREKAGESWPLHPSSPYSASKSGGDLMVLAAHRTYGFPGLITRAANNYGPYQYPEKLIPLFITNALEGKSLPVYGDGSQIRDWLYVEDHCAAIDLVWHQGQAGDVYNVGTEQDPEITNLELTKEIIRQTGASEGLMTSVKDRPGHDLRYSLDSRKLRALGWKPSVTFAEGLAKTVAWYKQHQPWWQKIKSGEYKEWYQKQYGG